ncbi:hypothetical protein [Oecophyllibacter saccharovorans]|uniref:Uncharacterized protein n=1 Tax=Oecophyllibacter saccharovorans TaxID=2558360 RepID=A0A506URP2_9PROT|nr:hypothetical protein [Oecophyllibacter saccharovorans]TPW36008.1 hypothetical protein E3202_03625 [Oecophyllibacter saccharovorans]
MVSIHIRNIPLRLRASLRRTDGHVLDLVGLTPMTGDTIGLDADHPTLLAYREKVPLKNAYAQEISPSKGLVFGLSEFSQKRVQPLEDMMIASLPPEMPNTPTQRSFSMRGYRIDITPRAVLHDGKRVAATPDGTPYQDGDVVQVDLAFLAYYPFGSGTRVTLHGSGGKYGPLQVTVPALSYAVTVQKMNLSAGHTQIVHMQNPVTHTRFTLSIEVLPLSALKTLHLRKDGSM